MNLESFIASARSSKPKWPDLNNELRARVITAIGGGLYDLWELSPIRIEDNNQHTEEIIDQLFPNNPLICAGRNPFRYDTKLREDWRGGLHERAFIVPSPMSAVRGITQAGKQDKHTLDNTGARRFLICEFDAGTLDDHAALLMHLGKFAPLVCAVHSGGKSLHGWFYVHAQADMKVEKFFQYAVSLGADHQLWSRTQFVRMPDGMRKDGKRQTVFYLNFNPLP